MRIIFILCLLALQCSGGQIKPDVAWEQDGYQVALWKLYHAFKDMRGHTEAELRGAALTLNLKETHFYASQYFSTRVFLLEGRMLQAVPQSHQIYLNVMTDLETSLLLDVEPSIVFEFEHPLLLPDLYKRFGDRKVVGRMLRLKSVKADLAADLGIDQIDVTYRDLRNRNLDWACNGFVIESNVVDKGASTRTMMYSVGSGLDPFFDRRGRERKKGFRSRDTLVDPQIGPACEKESSGAQVFLKE